MSSGPSNATDTSGDPAQCPVCGSANITASVVKAKPSTYWRCLVCGTVWHPERMRFVVRTGTRPR